MVVYLAGAYRWRGSKLVPPVIGELINIAKAWNIARKLWRDGYVVICPHVNSLLMDRMGCRPEQFLNGDLELVKAAEMVVMMPGWELSTGARTELSLARSLGIPCYAVDEDGHLTELNQ